MTQKKQTRYGALRALAQLSTATGWLIGIGGTAFAIITGLDSIIKGHAAVGLLGGALVILLSVFFGVLTCAIGDVVNILIDGVNLLRKIAFDKND